MVTTTAKKEPPPELELVLPESTQAKPGANGARPFVLSVAPREPCFWMGDKPVTCDRLQHEMMVAAKPDPKTGVVITADKATYAARAAHVGVINAVTEKTAAPSNAGLQTSATRGSLLVSGNPRRRLLRLS
jgi:biopolymer transport protein ExbD